MKKFFKPAEKRINYFERLPDELILKILNQYSLYDLMQTFLNFSQVDKRIHRIANDPAFWEKKFKKYFGFEMENKKDYNFKNFYFSYQKTNFFESSFEEINNPLLRKKIDKTDPRYEYLLQLFAFNKVDSILNAERAQKILLKLQTLQNEQHDLYYPLDHYFYQSNYRCCLSFYAEAARMTDGQTYQQLLKTAYEASQKTIEDKIKYRQVQIKDSGSADLGVEYLDPNKIEYKHFPALLYYGHNFPSNLMAQIEKNDFPYFFYLAIKGRNPVTTKHFYQLSCRKWDDRYGPILQDYAVALYAAIQQNDLPTCRYLVETLHVDVNTLIAKPLTASFLQTAISRGHFEIAKFLLEKGAQVEPSTLYRIIRTASKKSEEKRLETIKLVVEQLKTRQMSIDYADTTHPHQETALFEACTKNFSKIVKFLLENGADPFKWNDVNGPFQNPFMMAFLEDNFETSKIMFNAVKDPSAILDTHTEFPLLWTRALSSENNQLLEYILKDRRFVHLINTTDKDGFPPLGISLLKKDFPKMKLLLQHGASPNIRACYWSMMENTALIGAVRQGNIEIIKLLLNFEKDPRQISANPNEGVLRGNKNITPIFAAIQLNKVEIVKILLEAGADARSPNLLAVAACCKNKEIAELLLSHNKIDLHHPSFNAFGSEALIHASVLGSTEGVQFLLSKGVDINYPVKENLTALFSAAQEGKKEVVNLLLEHGANPNIHFKTTISSLKKFAENVKRQPLFEEFIKRKQQAGSENIEVSPAEIAKLMGHDEIEKIFQSIQKPIHHSI